jgi:hypothetical protein
MEGLSAFTAADQALEKKVIVGPICKSVGGGKSL